MTGKCGECRYWEALPNSSGAGDCRLHAPIVTGGMMSSIETVWPNTKPEQWCGEFSFDYAKTPPAPPPSSAPCPANCTCIDCIPF